MKIKDLIKELETFDKQLDIKCTLRDGTAYDIVKLDIGNHINGRRTTPFGKIVISSFNISNRDKEDTPTPHTPQMTAWANLMTINSDKTTSD